MDPGFVDAANYDYWLRASSPAIDAGADPGVANSVSLWPQFEYVDPLLVQPRQRIGPIDLGAFEGG